MMKKYAKSIDIIYHTAIYYAQRYIGLRYIEAEYIKEILYGRTH